MYSIHDFKNGKWKRPNTFKIHTKLYELYGKDEVSKYLDIKTTAISDNYNNSISVNNEHYIDANSTLDLAIKEISEQRKLVVKSQEQLSKSQEQIDRLITLLEHK